MRKETKKVELIICYECNGYKTITDYYGDRNFCEICGGQGMLKKVTIIVFDKIYVNK